MTTTPPLFTPNGDGYDIQPAGVLILLADEVYGENPSSNPRLKNTIDKFLTAARAGGFTQSDILETLLATGEVSHRVKAMAVAACDAAGRDAIEWIFASIRNKD
jgi:hypothetical protein